MVADQANKMANLINTNKRLRKTYNAARCGDSTRRGWPGQKRFSASPRGACPHRRCLSYVTSTAEAEEKSLSTVASKGLTNQS